MEHVTVVITDGYEIVGSVEVGYYPNAIAIDPSGEYVYVLQFALVVLGY